MKSSQLSAWILTILGIYCCSAVSVGQGTDNHPSARLRVLRQRLASLRPGTSAEEVLKLLGKPDEVRLGGSFVGEVERWAYATMGKGKFAKGGIVCLDKNGKVVTAAAPATDSMIQSISSERLPKQDQPGNDQAVESPSKLSCHLDIIEGKLLGVVGGNSKGEFKAKVSLKNAGKEGFELKGDKGFSMGSVVWFELYHSGGTILLGESYAKLLVAPFGREHVIVAVPAGKELSQELPGWILDTSDKFGRLPAGKYRLRVFFPFAREGYYPSNVVQFELTSDGIGKGHSKK